MTHRTHPNLEEVQRLTLKHIREGLARILDTLIALQESPRCPHCGAAIVTMHLIDQFVATCQCRLGPICGAFIYGRSESGEV